MNLLNFNGKLFIGKIRGRAVIGRIYVEKGKAYLCQNNEGNLPKIKYSHGYSHSYNVDSGSYEDLVEYGVTELQVINYDHEFFDGNIRDRVGRHFCAIINDQPVVGIIQKEKDRFYLCNDRFGGIECVDALGYSSSMHVSDVFASNIFQSGQVTDFKVLKPTYVDLDKEYSDLLTFSGVDFEAKIREREVTGKIQVEDGVVYLCQDKLDGDRCRNTLGYRYSWNVRHGTKEELSDRDVINFKLLKKCNNVTTKIEKCSDLELCDGSFFKCQYDYEYDVVYGQINVEDGKVYICQNVIEGASCEDKKGFDYSYYVGSGSHIILDDDDDITEFELISEAEFKRAKSSIASETSIVDGAKFSARIDDIPCEGVITIQDRYVYLCQNVKNGSSCIDKKGFKYSWSCGQLEDIKKDGLYDSIKDFKIINDMEEKDKDISKLLFASIGKYFEASINGQYVVGRINITYSDLRECNIIQLCQNNINGSDIKNKLGYTGSWCIGKGTPKEIEKEYVKNLRVLKEDFDCSCRTLSDDTIKILLNSHGRPFVATIAGDTCNGIITVENGEVYLCQNVQSGSRCEEKHGYDFSWTIGNEKDMSFSDNRVSCFEFINDIDESKKGKGEPENLSDMLFTSHGKYFSCKIMGTPVVGRVVVENDRIHLCQNEKSGEDTVVDKLGYNYSWGLLKGTPKDFGSEQVSDFRILNETMDCSVSKMSEDSINILLNSHGRAYKAKIHGDLVFGRIAVEDDEVYLCQNERDGKRYRDTLGYKYSWTLVEDKSISFKLTGVSEFEFIDPVETLKSTDDSVKSESKEDDSVCLSLKDSHGKYFAATIKGVDTIGRISVSLRDSGDYIYLCQDDQDGAYTSERFEYKYSWYAGNGTLEKLILNSVTNLIVFDSLEELKVYKSDKEFEVDLTPDSYKLGAINPEEKLVHGDYAVGKIYDKLFIGIISIYKDCIYIAQDVRCGGGSFDETVEKFGYKHSWYAGKSKKDLLSFGVTDFKTFKSLTEAIISYRLHNPSECDPVATSTVMSSNEVVSVLAETTTSDLLSYKINSISKQKNKITKLFKN